MRVELSAASAKKRGKTAVAMDSVGCADGLAERQVNWLAGGMASSWRPHTTYRLGAKHWLMTLENQLRVCTCFGGLSAFVITGFANLDPFIIEQYSNIIKSRNTKY